MFVLKNDAGQFWPRQGVSMLTSKLEDAMRFPTREAATKQRDKIHRRNPKGPFPWALEFLDPQV